MASGLPDDRVTALAEDERGVLWVGTRRGLARIEAGQVRAGPSELRGDFISALCADPAGGLWIGTGERGVARLDGAGLRLVGAAQGLPASTIMALTVDRDGALWIALQTAGVARLRDGKVEHLGAKEGLASDWVATVLEDREGSIWLGTQDGGLVRLRVADFRTIGAAEGLSHDAVEAVMQAANGDLWLATDGGVDLLKGGVLPATRIAAGTTMALRQDRSGDVWIGTVGMGLWRWRQGVLTRLGQDLPPNAWVRAIQEDREGTLWVGTSSGLYRLRGERLLPVEDGLPTQRPGVAALAVSAKGELFAALEGAGVYRRGGGRWKREDAGPPDAWMVGDFLADEDGTIWMASEGGGLWRRRGGSYAHVTTAQGFHADACWAILDDGQGNLWMSSNRGIFRVARADLEAVLDGKAPTLRPRAWTMDDGLRGQEAAGASQPGGWRTRDGRLWFALLSGAASVDPARLRPPPAMPEVALRAVEVRGLPQRHDAPLTLPPEAGRLELEFAARVLLGQKSAWFRYRLAGFEEAWSEPQRGHAAQYTNLPPGDFRFEVQTRLGDGAWGPVASLEIVQQPPAWRTPAALAGAAGGALALALGLFLLGLRLGRRGPPAAG
jgi:ligand-binding sensor domain-containing protein